MAEMAKGAVDSVLGTIGAAIGERAALMGSVRRDMRFIKGEMESMNGFLLDVDDPAEQSNQVQAWMRQVRDVAYESQSCIDRYVQTVGAGRSSAVLLGSVGRAPQVLLTLPARYRIAMQIKEIKSRAQEVGERRQRYGVQALATTARGGRGRAKEAEEDAAAAGRRRRVLADAEHLLDADAREVVAWVTRGGRHDANHRASPLSRSAGKFVRTLFSTTMFTNTADVELELATAAREVLGDGDPENIADAAAILSKQGSEITDKEISALIAAVKELLGFRRDPAKSSTAPAAGVGGGGRGSPDEHKPGTREKNQALIDALESLRVANTPTDVALAEKEYSDQLKEWLRKLFDNQLIEDLVLGGWLHNVVKHAQENKYIEMAIEAAPDAIHSIIQSVKKMLGNASTQEEPEKPGDTDHVQDKSPGNDSVPVQETSVPTETVHDVSAVEGITIMVAQGVGKAAQGVKKAAMGVFDDGKAAFDSVKKIAAATSDNSIIKPLAHSIENIESRVAWFQELVDHGGWRGDGGRPRILAIVTPAAGAHEPEKDGDLRPATNLAKTVYNMCISGHHFDCVAWIDAKCHADKTQRLRCLLQQVLLQSSSSREDVNTLTDEQLAKEIRSQLQDKKFLIVMADPPGDEDEAPWADIASALPPWDSHSHPDCSGSTIIVTPMVQQPVQFHGWYLASWLFLLKASRYKVHFYSHLEATSKKANELLVGGHDSRELQSIVKRILQKCRHDTFSTNMFLHALYANPRRRENELLALLNQLQDVGTMAIIAEEIIRFCHNDLPDHYKTCLNDLALFQKHTSCKIRRGSSIRRWAAQNNINNRRQALDEAERGFNALVDRGLVLLQDPSPTGKAKSCNLPPQVLTFIETNTSSEVNVVNGHLPSDLVPRMSIRNRVQLEQLPNGRRPTNFSLCQRLLKCTSPANAEDSKYPSSVISFLNSLPASSQLGLIMVLDLEGCPGLNRDNLKNICNKKFHLKYLSLRKTEVDDLPKEIGRLQELETLDIRETNIKSFPMEANMLQKLIHLLAGEAATHNKSLDTIHMPGVIGSMTKIQVLYHVEVSGDNVGMLNMVGQLQQLRKFGVVIPCNDHDVVDRLLTEIGKLDECLTSLSVHIKEAEGPDVPPVDMKERVTISHPRSLQSLKITGKILELPTWTRKLHRLSKITLWRTSLSAEHIGILGKLMNLRIVILRRDSCAERGLTFKQKEFPHLELFVIEVEGTQISNISFEQTTAPKLEKIVWTSTSTTRKEDTSSLDMANKADMSGIDKLPSLREIELHCNSFDMDRCSFNMVNIKREMWENPNNPILKEITPKDVGATAAPGASLIPDSR